MKKSILAIVFVAVFAFAMVAPVNAFFTPGNPVADDRLFNNYGPMTQNLLMIPYGGYATEYLNYHACSIDFMDWPLQAGDVAALQAEDPNMNTYARCFFVQRGMYELDINNMRFPTDDVWFRKAISMCFDKDSFIANTLGGLALKMDSPLSCNPGWYNPYCTNLYPYSLVNAQAMLDAHGYTVKGSDTWRTGPLGEPITLEQWTRQDDSDRTAMGNLFAATLLSIKINVNNHVAPKTTCKQHSMAAPFDYNIYTGGWSFGRDPDTLYFLYAHEPQGFDYCPNYPGYSNPDFTLHADAMLTAADALPAETECTAKNHVFAMQKDLMDDAAIIPVYTYASYGAYKTGWQKVCNSDGTGPWSWYTFLDTYQQGKDTIKWGQLNDIDTLNVLHSNWVWDWNMLGEIYDSMINVDPYDMGHDLPWMAQSWTIGTWTYGGDTCTTIEFKLREDMYWQDVAPMQGRQTPGGKPLLVNGATDVKVTADDVVFSYMAVKNLVTAWNHDSVADMVYAEKMDPYTVKVYMDVFMPLWALHWVGGLPILPMHVWKPVYDEGTTLTFDVFDQNCAVGSGPWQLDVVASSRHNYYMLRRYTRHFAYHPLDITGGPVDTYKVLQPCTNVTINFYWHWQDVQRVLPPSEYTVTCWAHVPIDTAAKLPDGTIVVIPACTWVKLWEISNPMLPYCQKIYAFNITIHVGIGLYEFRTDVTPDVLTGHTDQDGYPVILWGTIREDINLDFHVNAKDAVKLGAAFGSQPGPGFINWDPACDMNHDGYVNAKDAVKIGAQFGWPT